MPKPVTNLVAGNGRQKEQEHEQVDIYMEHALLRQEANREEQCVAREDKTNHEAGFGKNNRHNPNDANGVDNIGHTRTK